MRHLLGSSCPRQCVLCERCSRNSKTVSIPRRVRPPFGKSVPKEWRLSQDHTCAGIYLHTRQCGVSSNKKHDKSRRSPLLRTRSVSRMLQCEDEDKRVKSTFCSILIAGFRRGFSTAQRAIFAGSCPVCFISEAVCSNSKLEGVSLKSSRRSEFQQPERFLLNRTGCP